MKDPTHTLPLLCAAVSAPRGRVGNQPPRESATSPGTNRTGISGSFVQLTALTWNLVKQRLLLAQGDNGNYSHSQ